MPSAPTLSWQGWLHKRGGRNPAYKRRWMLLRDEQLLYFAAAPNGASGLSAAAANGTIALIAAVVRAEGDDGSFDLVTSDRTFHLKASDAIERTAWLAALQSAGVRKEVEVQAGAMPTGEAVPVWDEEAQASARKMLAALAGSDQMASAYGWVQEWPEMRLHELRLEGKLDVATRAHVGKGGSQGLDVWLNSKVKRQAVAWQIDTLGWEKSDAEGFTMVTGLCPQAISAAVRTGRPQYSASIKMIMSVLGRSAASVNAPAPPAYYPLTGKWSLVANDPAWQCLLGPSVAPGASFHTSTSTLARVGCFPNRSGFHERLADTSGREYHELADARVVCIQSAAPSADGRLRSLVQTSPVRWELPPLTRVTLEKVSYPGEWRSVPEGTAVEQVLYTVSVEWAP